MAIIQPILGTLRGSIGDNTFSHNRGGDYVRRRVAPTNPNSTRQQTMRTFLGTLAALWSSTLTPAQREQWNTWAGNQSKEGPLGNSINWSGINGYVSLNAHLLDSGDARIDAPPVVVAPTGLLTLSIDISAITTADVTFTATPLAANHKLVMFMSLPQSGTAEPNFKQCRIVGYSAAAQASPWASTLPFSVISGQTVVFFVAIMDDATGLFSPFLRSVDASDY
ncbi:MAG: hypothetical protein KAJ06_06760 [Gammaproteobacteria bacterium]|nr:hypothetical protein [Gammaproteobacteria bacterium]